MKIVITADVQDRSEGVPAKPLVEPVDIRRIAAESIAAISTMNEDIAMQFAKFFMASVGVTNDYYSQGLLRNLAPIRQGRQIVYETPARLSKAFVLQRL